ncbi:hypothetical protein M9H77_36281 [Catharanthus roseus]|uniref:Uncharacterized protein n=1 Tax=Catharanthus roseus TaxID=4058 RepID=A0ACB9ZTY9_CATRO|nr:hypothetical protein M9H77_36281 [Catharanthus roseus]
MVKDWHRRTIKKDLRNEQEREKVPSSTISSSDVDCHFGMLDKGKIIGVVANGRQARKRHRNRLFLYSVLCKSATINFSDTSLKSLSEALNQEDLLVIKNFELKIEEEEGGTYVNVLYRVLNREESFRGFDQARRVPVILLAHSIPKGMLEPRPMQS